MKIKLKSLLFIHVRAHLLELLHDAASLTSRDREWGRGAAVIISMPHIWGSWLRPWGFWHRGLLEDDRHTQKDWELTREKRKEMSTPTCLVECTLFSCVYSRLPVTNKAWTELKSPSAGADKWLSYLQEALQSQHTWDVPSAWVLSFSSVQSPPAVSAIAAFPSSQLCWPPEVAWSQPEKMSTVRENTA